MEELSLGPVPGEEDCAQVGTPDYYDKAPKECRRYIALLRQKFGPEPEGARFRIKRCPHDFGTYLDVVIEYDGRVEAALQYAFRVDANQPVRWDE